MVQGASGGLQVSTLPASGARSSPPPRPKDLSPAELGFTRQPFVRWFHPFELARAAVRAVLADMFGAYTDRRELQAALYPRTAELAFDYSAPPEPGAAPPEELWLDYVADIGDGFNATYAIASLLARESLVLPGPRGEVETRRGRLLVMGGDQVYPAASRVEYKERTVGPYRAALPFVADERAAPHLFAIPGNHDWYDGLSAFLRQFTQRRWIGAWLTQQERSYFVLALPHRVWLWGIDIQLHADIDGPQLAYFDAAAARLAAGDRVILCTAEPSWVEVPSGKREGYENLAFVESKVLARGARVVLVLTGDSHHYARYVEPAVERHYVTAGGGGAFLHGTHSLPLQISLAGPEGVARGAPRLERHATFPRPEESLAMIRHLLSFSAKNRQFALLWGCVWLLTGWCLFSASVPPGRSLDVARTFVGALGRAAAVPSALYLPEGRLAALAMLALAVALTLGSIHRTRLASQGGTPELDYLRLAFDVGLWLTLTAAPALCLGPEPFMVLFEALARSPTAVSLILGVLLGSMVFVSHERKLLRAGVGAAHALVHVLAWLVVASFLARLLAPGSVAPLLGSWGALGQFASVTIWLGTSSALAGLTSATVFGIYLWYAGMYLPEQLNDAFSALGIEGYKNFVRLHIDRQGTVTAYPIGLRRVPSGDDWVLNPDAGESAPFLVPRQSRALAPELIEPPIVIARRSEPAPLA